MFDVTHEVVARFDEGADEHARRIFARDLMAKLTKIGVKPGETFIVLSAEELELIEGRVDEKDSDIEELSAELEQVRYDAEDAEQLQELIKDYSRGVVTHAELMDAAGARHLAAA